MTAAAVAPAALTPAALTPAAVAHAGVAPAARRGAAVRHPRGGRVAPPRVTFPAMPAIQVHDVPPELHEALRHRAAMARVSLNAYVLDLLEQDVSRAGTRRWLDLLARREPVTGVDVNTTLDRARSTQRASRTGRAADGLRR